jgi:hypothetical protein
LRRQPWAGVASSSHVCALSAVLTGAEDTARGCQLGGAYRGEAIRCPGPGHVPLRDGSVDVLLLILRASALEKPRPPHLSTLGKLLAPGGVMFVVLPGLLDAAAVAKVQGELLPHRLLLRTARAIDEQAAAHVGTYVKEAAAQAQSGLTGVPYGFSLLQAQPASPDEVAPISTGDRALGDHVADLIRRSHAAAALPIDGVAVPSAEDAEFFRPLPPEGSFPHLANYYDWQAVYPELRALVDGFDVIYKEAMGISGWTPWPEYHFRDGGESDWRVWPLMHTFPAHDASRSQWVEATGRTCPETVRLLKRLPRLRTALFSRLGPGTKLSAHTGWEDLANFVLRCHLSLKVPQGNVCGTWVEGEVRYHRERDFVVFDDSKVHKAFNLHPTESRIVLIVDMLRPDTLPVGVAKGGHTPELEDFISAFR